ncbi:EAL domain-containing response regulator [Alkalimonas delamerensis]|uniref:EAL domain-containing response regulator n=1 Tax=Alkalimonas delamerensis TaxID=265981 RepID=A0ABT9GNG7_9GAMM|nr:EAL domain-containing response regulator [Alkalimonas delamerensis]MDP4528512.1 EAL domain-containing response regulator [Alkalimonas delamerensis]
MNDEEQLLANGQLRIAVIDDNIEFANLLTKFLLKQGYLVSVFHASQAFLDHDFLAFDAILLDLYMPDPDGVAVMRQLTLHHYQGAVVLMSGEDKGVLRSALELSKVQSLSRVVSLQKPFQLTALSDLIQQLIANQVKPNHAVTSNWQPDEAAIFQAIDDNGLQLFFQPKVQLDTQQLVGFEALLRWQHPDYGLIMPVRFIPIAEQSVGLMQQLTKKVILLGLTQLQQWQQLGHSVVISINVSMINLAALDFPEWLQKQVELYGLQPQQLHLEVTETALMNEVAQALDILVRLKMKGFVLSIDDFGTGYSSLAQLHRIPFSELKIDKSFVLDMTSNDESKAIVETCLFLGKRLGLEVIAEGVEDEATRQALLAMGCCIGQGYFWSRPVPAKEAELWLCKQNRGM